ncbi:hypothetical protein KR222_003516 [Zaprionus bogoriensis]|nr:hypothetical protein KR222_003516 [Zaprionus bogoriensis]
MAQISCWLKIVALVAFCLVNIYHFVISCTVSYQEQLAQQHVYFRAAMPTMDSWVNSPFGKLKSYLFNVTNSVEFLNGTDTRLKLQQVGPIVYEIIGFNDVLNRTEDSITYRKHRYHKIKFLPEESVSPDILNKTIVQFNSVLLGGTAKFANMMFPGMWINPLNFGEPLFLTGSIYYFLWEFSRDNLQLLSKIMPLSTNCGPLYNALKEKEEVFTVNIGPKHGINDFFRIQSLNNNQLMRERARRLSWAQAEECPINVTNTHDNSLFPPLLTKQTPLNIVASESCRILPMHYQREEQYDGITGYRYTLLQPNETMPSCMDRTYGVQLPRGMFDVSHCMINDAPSAFSAPHFYGSDYNWTEHFEGLTPNAEDHEAFILLEPTLGIPITEKYRFQSVTPMPNLRSFGPVMNKLSHWIVPTFWYEFEMGHLPGFVLGLIRLNVQWMPVLQPSLMSLQLLLCVWALLSLLRRCSGSYSYGELYRWLSSCGASSAPLKTVLNQRPQHEPPLPVSNKPDKQLE